MDSSSAQEVEGLQKIEFRAMGSEMLAAVKSEDPRAGALLAEVPGWFAGWEQALSRFREDSELSKLNRASDGTTPIAVSETLWEVLQVALQAARATHGLVTPTVLNALVAAGYTTSFDAMKEKAGEAESQGPQPGKEQPAASPVAGWRNIRTDPAAHIVVLPEGVRLDFGGIAKGWAADQAADRLSECGPALINAGGDIAVRGTALEGYEWVIGVDAPTFPGFEPDEQLELLSIVSGGVATSGRDYRRWQRDGQWRHHIIDPRTGEPANTDIVAATVVATTAGQAEIAAKVVLVLGSADGLEWLKAQPALGGLLVLENGQVLRSKRLGHYLWSSLHAN